MSTVEHAKKEFEVLGWPGDCEMQKLACENILELLQVFVDQGHSGFSAPYILSYFEKLARQQPISPLTGNDEEWIDISEISEKTLYQNKRDSEVFKSSDGAYWISGRIFVDSKGNSFINKDSRVPVEFPWTRPKPEIIERD